MMGYYQFKKVWLSLVDVRAELRSRREKFNRFLPTSALAKKLEALVTLEEQQEAKTLLEAANSLDDEKLARARRALVDEALLLARVVLSEALDAAGQVYVFGKGPANCFDGDPVRPDFADFMEYERIDELWRERVRPDANAAVKPRGPETDEKSTFDKLHSASADQVALPATAATAVLQSHSRITLVAAARAFANRQVSLMTAFLWGKRVQSVAVGSVVAYAVTDTGEVFCWGGKQRAWRYFYDHSTLEAGASGYSVERPPSSCGSSDLARRLPNDSRRPLTTRSEMLKLVAPSHLAAKQTQYEQRLLRTKYARTFVKPVQMLPTDEDKQAQLLLVGRYYDLVPDAPAAVAAAGGDAASATPAPSVPSLQDLLETVEPELQVDDLALSLQMRGVYLAKETRMELLEKLGACLALELECVGDAFHAHMKAQDKIARRLRNDRREKAMLEVTARTAAQWYDLGVLQESIVTAERDAFATSQDAYVTMKRKILAAKQKATRQAREGVRTGDNDDSDASLSALRLDTNGLTARGSPLQPFNSQQAVECIAVGSRHALAVQQSGTLLAWGAGSFGRLGGAHDLSAANSNSGSGNSTAQSPPRYSRDDPAAWHSDAHVPTVVDALATHRFRAVACGFGHSLALSNQGSVFAWGSATHGKLGIGDVDVAESFTLTPVPLVLPQGVVVRKIACGPSHSALLTTRGHLYVWGSGDGGKLGLGDGRDVGPNMVPRNGGQLRVLSTPTRVVAPFETETLVEVSCGAGHTAVLSTTSLTDGKVVGGGRLYVAGSSHALAKFTPTFMLLPVVDSSSHEHVAITRVSCGNAHTAVVSSEGELFTWGTNTGGCTGHSLLLPKVTVPTRVSCLYQRPMNLCRLDGVQTLQSTQNGTCLSDYALRSSGVASDYAQTQHEMCPFWQVALVRLSRIESVRVVIVDKSASAAASSTSRDDSAPVVTMRPSSSAVALKYAILISPFPFETDERGKYSLALAKRQSTHVTFRLDAQTSRDRTHVWTLPVDTFGRYVRVQLDNCAGMLGLEAVDVVGMDSAEYKGPRVSDAVCGEAVTTAICRPLSSDAMLRERFLRAVRADRASLTILQQLETFQPYLQDELVREGYVAGSSSSSSCVLCRPREQCVVCLLEHAIVADGNALAAVKRSESTNQSSAGAAVAAATAAVAQQRAREAARRDTLRHLTLDELGHTLLAMSMRTEEEEAAQQKRLEQELQDLNALAIGDTASKQPRSALAQRGTGPPSPQQLSRTGIVTTLRRVLGLDRAVGASAKVLAAVAAAPPSSSQAISSPSVS